MQKKIAKNSFVGMVAVAIYLVSRIAITPYVLAYITLTEFGLWSACFMILSYAALGAFGVNNAYIKFTAEYHSQKSPDSISSLLSTGLFCMTVFAVAFYILLYIFIPYVMDIFRVEPEMMELAGFMILGTTVAFFIDLIFGGFRSTLEGLQEIALAKTISIGAALLEVLFILLFMYMGSGVKGLLYAYFIRTITESVFCILKLYKKLPGIKIAPNMISKDAFKHLSVFGGKVQVLGGLAIFISTLDRLVITSMIGLAATGLFEIGRKFPFTGKSVSGAAFGPFLPAASYIGARWQREEVLPVRERALNYLWIALAAASLATLPVVYWGSMAMDALGYQAEAPSNVTAFLAFIFLILSIFFCGRVCRKFSDQDRLINDELRNLYLNGLRHINLINVTLFAFLISAARPIIHGWVGMEYISAVPVMIILSLSYLIHQGTGPSSLIFRGIDRSGREFEFLIIHLILSVFWIPLGAILNGLVGASLGILAATALASLFVFWRTNQTFSILWKDFFRISIYPGITPVMPALAVALLLSKWVVADRIEAAIQVLISGFFYIAATGFLLWIWFLSEEEKNMIGSFVNRYKPISRLKLKKRGPSS